MKGSGHCDRYCHFHVVCARVVICAVFDREVERVRDVVASDEVSLEILSIGALEFFCVNWIFPLNAEDSHIIAGAWCAREGALGVCELVILAG